MKDLDQQLSYIGTAATVAALIIETVQITSGNGTIISATGLLIGALIIGTNYALLRSPFSWGSRCGVCLYP